VTGTLFASLLASPPVAVGLFAYFGNGRSALTAAVFAVGMFALIIGALVGESQVSPVATLVVSLTYTTFEGAVCAVVALLLRALRRTGDR
jgi:hypothetical protein